MNFKENSVLLVKNSNDGLPINEISQRFTTPITFTRDYKIALAQCNMYYSWRNITAALANNQLKYTFNGVSSTINFPDGFYSITDIDGYLKLKMFENGHYLLDASNEPVYFLTLQENITYYAFTLTASIIPAVLPAGYTNPNGIVLSGETPQLEILNNGMRSILGFAAGLYPAAPSLTTYMVNSSSVPQITPISTINIRCNLVNNSQFNINHPDVLYSFVPSSSYGEFFSIQPNNLIFLPIITSSFSELKLTFTDQNNNPLSMLDTNYNLTVILRSKE